MEFGLGRTQADQDNNRVGRIKAVMGMAIGNPPVNRGINLEKIAASTVLYRGALEVNQGAFARWGISEGDRVRITSP